MSDTYVNKDARSESLNDAAAHDKGLYDPNTQDNQIVALYETMAEANKARDMLLGAGIDAGSVQVMDKSADPMAGGVDYESGHQGMWGAIKSLFMPDDEAHAYNHAIDRGHAMVVVSPARTANREAIIHTLEASHPLDFDAKLEEWRQSGYDYSGMPAGQASQSRSATVDRAEGTPRNYAVNQTTVTDNIPATAGMPSPAAAPVATPMANAGASGSTDTIKVMEERLRVGKREVAAGTVRVRSYVVERPVEEQVRLHEERIQLERRPVDRPATDADAAGAFQERIIEAQATAEEAVVSKDVRIIEEIGLRKEATDRTETVRDTVRKTEVEVDDSTVVVHPDTHGSLPSSTGGASTSTAGATTSGMNAPRK